MFHAKFVEIIAQESTTEYMRVMDVLAFLNDQYAVIVNMCANQNPMDSAKLIRLIGINAERVVSKGVLKLV
jgi:hypothetical protein